MSNENNQGNIKVGVVMGSDSDWDVMQHACKTLDEFAIPYEHKIVSAHRTPDRTLTLIKSSGYMVDDIPESDPIYTDLKFFEDNFDGLMPLEIMVDTKSLATRRGRRSRIERCSRAESPWAVA